MGELTKKPRPVSQNKILEKQVTSDVKKYLMLRGWRPLRMQRTVLPGQFSTCEPGTPDILFLRYDTTALHSPGWGQMLWIEFKSPAGHLGPKQVEWIDKEKARGAIVLVVDDLDEFVAYYEKAFGVSGQLRLG
jgi:hypothetical protein